MPMYSFECTQCGKRFEEIVSYDKREAVVCPECKGETKVMVAACASVSGSASGSSSAPGKGRFT